MSVLDLPGTRKAGGEQGGCSSCQALELERNSPESHQGWPRRLRVPRQSSEATDRARPLQGAGGVCPGLGHRSSHCPTAEPGRENQHLGVRAGGLELVLGRVGILPGAQEGPLPSLTDPAPAAAVFFLTTSC